MELEIIVRCLGEVENSKEVVERLVEHNMETKLDQYIEKFKKEDAQGRIEVVVDKNKKWLFDAKIQAQLDGKIFRFEREDYKNLDDLVNHLFDHFKEALSDM